MGPSALEQTYALIVDGYLSGNVERALGDADDVGRRTVGIEGGLLSLIGAYHAALGRAVAGAGSVSDAANVVERAAAIVVQSLAPYEIALSYLRETTQGLPPELESRDTLHVGRTKSDERTRLASAIHADAVQSLAAVGTRLDLLARQLDDLDTAAGASSSDLLTEREREILGMISGGATNADVARRLVISENTVKSHVKNILRKLGVRNRAQAAARYFIPHSTEG
ncbi:MAG: hypothetical protein QOG41_156 [Thermoleophilaceae bacterium]|nr:hypothetical protein [Thermoleophilaceae bacterium]MEA2387383.1 hypothetical protein [Thermoleophilaceae bacterium]